MSGSNSGAPRRAVVAINIASSTTKRSEPSGIHIVGAHATALIHELAVTRENEFTLEEIELAIHGHPTLSEAIAEAALDAMGRMVHA